MSPTTWLAELRHRGVLKVAAGYLALGWLLLQAVSLLFQNFGAPAWALKAFTTVVVIGFPVACLLAWGLEFTPQGIHTAPPLASESPVAPRRSDTLFGVLLLLILGLVGASVVHEWRMPVPAPATTSAVGTPPAPTTVATSPALPETTARAAVDPDAPPSIAVLPFVDMSAEHDQQYLGDGIAEELLNALASIEGLNVAARTSSFSFHGKGVGVKEIGDTLHVRHVLEGSVRRSGPKLRVTAQLIDVDTGFHLYSQAYDREVKDIFDIQNEIAREIVNALKPKLGIGKDANLIRQGTANLEAYNLRLKARQWLTNTSPATVEPTVRQLREAVALDPAYSDAWGDLAYVYAFSTIWSPDPTREFVLASNAASIALSRSPDNVPALLAQACVQQVVFNDVAASAESYERARRAGADLTVWAYNKAQLFYAPLGRHAEAIALLEEAAGKDPLAPNLKQSLVDLSATAGRLADARRVSDELEALGPPTVPTLAFIGYLDVAAGDLDAARQRVAALRQATSPDFWHVLALQFRIDAATGDLERARRELDRLLAKQAAGEPVSPYAIAEGFRVVGDVRGAVEWWQRALERHHPHGLLMTSRFRADPVIGQDPRFLALLKRFGLDGMPKPKDGSPPNRPDVRP